LPGHNNTRPEQEAPVQGEYPPLMTGVGIVQVDITVFVIDKHPIIGWALREYLSQHSRITVLGIAVSAHEALSVIHQKKPDVVVLGASQPDIACIKAISNVVETGAQVVAFCDINRKELIEALIDAGGTGIVPKSSPIDDLKTAIESVAQKKRWISPVLQRIISVEPPPDSTKPLTNREREIVMLVAQGLSSRMIAERLFISVNTVESHRKRIFKKLNVGTCAQLVRYAVKEGLILEHG
jgi:DNA-binding NarL/FixJ family response regulator